MDAILQGDGIAVGYQDNLIIPTLSVGIPRGQITAIIGPNGCGKSTLLKALSRTMPLQSGQIILDGEAIARLSTVEVARQMAILPHCLGLVSDAHGGAGGARHRCAFRRSASACLDCHGSGAGYAADSVG